MVESPFSLYKLIILFVLDRVPYPLKNTQIADLFLHYGYTSYFHLQQVLSEMIESELVTAESKDHATLYRIAPRGEETISFFSGDISPEIRKEIQDYLAEHEQELRSEEQTAADYTRTSEQDYTVHCTVKEGSYTLIDLRLSAPSEKAARTLAENWKRRSADAYEALMRVLR